MSEIIGLFIAMSMVGIAVGCIMTGYSCYRLIFGWKEMAKDLIDWSLTEGMDEAIHQTEKNLSKIFDVDNDQ